MYTEGYVSKVEVTEAGTCDFWIDPQTPFRLKYGDDIWTLAVKVEGDKIVDGKCVLLSPVNPFKMVFEKMLDKATLVALKTGHCKVGIEFTEKSPRRVTKIVCL